ncbi:hypothetical protein EYF80_021230 [Liparis tanakae]|uniref:Uncharacterized protein n=1 Tax=Liparis tanakae TaxID=230148 RepID=A0A4Z2HUA5_9TELE|nr:hypothetical protein EYF80_021230 [Liparis tanakae]
MLRTGSERFHKRGADEFPKNTTVKLNLIVSIGAEVQNKPQVEAALPPLHFHHAEPRRQVSVQVCVGPTKINDVH